MKKILDSFTWIFLLIFFLPTTLIVASWNSLPGDSLYPVKLGLESTLFFFVKPSYAAQSKLSVKYTERRFSEAKRLLSDKASVEGLPYLERQVTATKSVIDRAPNQSAKKELAKEYLVTLQQVSNDLEEEKQAATTPEPQASEPEEEKNSVEEEITQTQETIEEVISELEDIAQSPNIPTTEEDSWLISPTPEVEEDEPGNSEFGHEQGKDKEKENE